MMSSSPSSAAAAEKSAKEAADRAWREENGARTKLRRILSNSGSAASQTQRAVELMQSYPTLASELFRQAAQETPCLVTSYTPLMYFTLRVAAGGCIAMTNNNNNNINSETSSEIDASATATSPTSSSSSNATDPVIETLQTVYDLYPGAIAQPNTRGRLPLHEACSLSAPDSVLHFLMDNYPQAASVVDDCGLFPFHHALRGARHASLPILKRMLELHPPAFDTCDFGGMRPLGRAIVDEYSSDVLQLLFHQWLVANTQYPDPTGHYALPEDATVSEELAKGVSVLLPHLQDFAAIGSQWTRAGMERLLNELLVFANHDESLWRLELRLPRHVFNDNNDEEVMATCAAHSPTPPQQQQQQQTCATTSAAQKQQQRPSSTLLLLERLFNPPNKNCGRSICSNLTFYGDAVTTRPATRRGINRIENEQGNNDNPIFRAIHNGVIRVPHNNNNNNNNNTTLTSCPRFKRRLEELCLNNFELVGPEVLELVSNILLSPRAPAHVLLDTISVVGVNNGEHFDWNQTNEKKNNLVGASRGGDTNQTDRPDNIMSNIQRLTLMNVHGDWLCHLLLNRFIARSCVKNLIVSSSHTSITNNRNQHNHNQSLMTQTICQFLLSKDTTLEKLKVEDLEDSNQYIFLTQAMAQNTHLKDYHVCHNGIDGNLGATIRVNRKNEECMVSLLKHQNTTLERARFEFNWDHDSTNISDDEANANDNDNNDDDDDDEADASSSNSASDDNTPLDAKIDYFTRLNLYGRKEARKPGISKHRLVDLITTVVLAQSNDINDDDNDDDDDDDDDDDRESDDNQNDASSVNGVCSVHESSLDMYNVLFGLLGETPSIWSDSNADMVGVAGKKRRRGHDSPIEGASQRRKQSCG